MAPLSATQTMKHVHFKLPAIIITTKTPGDQPDSFTHEDVKLDPFIFQKAKMELEFKPISVMFASYKHHQLHGITAE